MPDLTPKIGLMKPLGNETVRRATYNENLDLIDDVVGGHSDDHDNPHTIDFTPATTRENISPLKRLSLTFGKIAKWFSDLKSIAFSGSASDIITGLLSMTFGGTGGKNRSEAWDNIVKGGGTIAGNVELGPNCLIKLFRDIGFAGTVQTDYRRYLDLVASDIDTANTDRLVFRICSPNSLDGGIKTMLQLVRTVGGAQTWYRVLHTGNTRRATVTRATQAYPTGAVSTGASISFAQTFDTIPSVVLTSGYPGLSVSVDSITTTGFKYSIWNSLGVNIPSVAVPLHYVACDM